MKSRVAILGMLVTGVLFSTAGAGLALQSDNAAVTQYGTPTPTPTYVCTPTGNVNAAENQAPSADECGETGVLPAEAENAPSPAAESDTGTTGTLPSTDSNTGTQPERQAAAAAEGSDLPFTGFAAIPVLLGGLALLTGGLLLRRRTREH